MHRCEMESGTILLLASVSKLGGPGWCSTISRRRHLDSTFNALLPKKQRCIGVGHRQQMWWPMPLQRLIQWSRIAIPIHRCDDLLALVEQTGKCDDSPEIVTATMEMGR